MVPETSGTPDILYRTVELTREWIPYLVLLSSHWVRARLELSDCQTGIAEKASLICKCEGVMVRIIIN